MKTLITHINPHLDDISAIWLFKKFFPEFRDAEVNFINASRDEAIKNESEDKVYFGTGGGKYDEHKGDLEDCAVSLVWKDIKAKGLAPKDEAWLNAYEELVEWSRLIDLGKAPNQEFSIYSIQSFIRSLDDSKESSLESQNLGEKILDRVLNNVKNKHKSLRDWEKRAEFETKFGKTIAVESETINRPFAKEMGGDLFLMYDPKKTDVQFFTPRFDLDLEPIYKKVKELDLEADWFLHQSHHMVICGSGAAPDSKRTKLSFEQLVDVLKNI